MATSTYAAAVDYQCSGVLSADKSTCTTESVSTVTPVYSCGSGGLLQGDGITCKSINTYDAIPNKVCDTAIG